MSGKIDRLSFPALHPCLDNTLDSGADAAPLNCVSGERCGRQR